MFRRISGQPSVAMISGAVTQYTTNVGTTIANNVTIKYAQSVKSGTQLLAVNGVAGTSQTSVSQPTVTQMNIGSNQGSTAQWQGYIQRITLFNNYFSPTAVGLTQ